MGAKTQEVSGAAANLRGGQNGRGHLFGIPMGDLGWFASLLMGAATGFAAFFAGTFAGIVGIMLYNSTGHGPLDYAYSYTRVGLPIGLLVLATAWAYLGTLWVRRQTGRK
jgi:hypothetical protein